MCSPTLVRASSKTSSEETDSGDDRRDDRDLANVDVADRDRPVQRRQRARRSCRAARTRAARCSAAGMRRRTSPPASPPASGPRSGRKTTLSISSDSASTTAKQSTIPIHDRPAALGRERERVRAGHDQLPVREVDEPEDAEDETDADRHQRIDPAQPDSVGERLPVAAEKRPSRSCEVRGHERLGVVRGLRARASARSRPFEST